MDNFHIQECFDSWCKKLRISPQWDAVLSLVDDPLWRKTGDIKIDCDGRKAIVLLNIANPRQDNLEHVIIHELFHLKMYPLDQVTESLITSYIKAETPESNFAYTQFFMALEQTVDELTKCFVLEFCEDKELSFGRCSSKKSFNELFDGLKNLE